MRTLGPLRPRHRPASDGIRTSRPSHGRTVSYVVERRSRAYGAELAARQLMSKPREVLPRQFYLITRRCTQRQFLLRPDDATNNAFTYCLGVAAARHRIDVLLTVAESNHHHTVIYDRDGTCP